MLRRIEQRVLWLSTYMVHHANSIRPSSDGTKVGGHQASSASVVSLMTALYFGALRSTDVVAVKAHGSPAFYAIQYLRGRLDASALRELRSFGGLQAYPSRRKNPEIVDLSTGSMGLGAVQATFGALATRYLLDHAGATASDSGRAAGTVTPDRFIVMVGDAELDEGNVWEALAEEIVAALPSVLWIVDVNRQSLDRIAPDARRRQLPELFRTFGWHVIELRYGSRMESVLQRPGGQRLRARLDNMPYAEFQGLLRLPPAAMRKALVTTPDGGIDRVTERILARFTDDQLAEVVTELGGHDLGLILYTLQEAERHRDGPCVILAHTIKGWGLPLAADPLNHTMLLSAAQIETLRASLGIEPGHEWDAFPDDSDEAQLIRAQPPLFTPPAVSSAASHGGALAPSSPAPSATSSIAVPDTLDEQYPAETSTQEAFGRVLSALARRPTGDAIVTVSADVAVTTHLAGWINRRGVYYPRTKASVASDTTQAVQWRESPAGQHIELGIAEHNLFLLLGALGLTGQLSGRPLLPIGTLYDPFVTRGLDALYHALYSGSRFIVVATPSGVSLAPEGGAHQSVITPGIGVALPDITYYEPVFAREVEWVLLESLRRLLDRRVGDERTAGDGAPARGGSAYLRLSTRPLDQRLAPPSSAEHRAAVLRGGYRLVDARAEPAWDPETNAIHIFAAGVMIPEALQARATLRDGGVFANVFAVTSPDLLYRGLRDPGTTDPYGSAPRGRRNPRPYLEELVTADEEGVPIVSVLDGHSHALAFLGSALGVPQLALGVDDFGQSGTRADLYRHYGIDAPAIVRAARTLLGRAADEA